MVLSFHLTMAASSPILEATAKGDSLTDNIFDTFNLGHSSLDKDFAIKSDSEEAEKYFVN